MQQQQHHGDHQISQKEHKLWDSFVHSELWQTDPMYHVSYEGLLVQHRLPQALTEESDFHQSYSTGWICTNDPSQQIEIDILNKVMRRKCKIIAKVKPLISGELEVTSITTEETSQVVITIDRGHLAARAGSMWQRRRKFKVDWATRHALEGWRGYVPLPFCVFDAEGSDTDQETTRQILHDTTTTANSTTKQAPKRRGKRYKGHYYRVHLQLRSILPIEWFPAIARIIVEQMRANANEGTKVDTKMETYANSQR